MSNSQRAISLSAVARQEAVIGLIADYFLLDKAKVGLHSRLVEDLGADSLEILEITLTLNERFDIELPEEELAAVRTVGDLFRMVELLS